MKVFVGKSSKGFTIVEMLVATAVFSVVLMICTTALLQISRTFQKGVTVTNTQEVARSVIDEISDSISYSAGDIQPLTVNNGSEGFCIGNLRYSYLRGIMLNEASTTHAFVVDRLDQLAPPLQCSTTVQALNLSTNPLPNNPRELLAPRMRVARFSITNQGGISRLYSVNIKLVTGEFDLLIPKPASENTPADPIVKCGGILTGSQYCSTVELTTVVQKRLQ